MNTHALLRAPYRLARLPLTVVESRLVALMANDSPPRLAFERALGSLDMVAAGCCVMIGSPRQACGY